MRVYSFNSDGKSIELPNKEQLPWPAQFVLQSYHKKHIFCSSKPKRNIISRCINTWINKRKWQIHFARAAAYDALYADPSVPVPDRFRQLRSKKKSCAPCGEDIDPVIESYFSDLHATLTRAASVTFRASHGDTFRNINPLVRLGLRIIRNDLFEVLGNDKDGGFCILENGTIQRLKQDILSSENYTVKSMNVDIVGELCQEYSEICLRRSVLLSFLAYKMLCVMTWPLHPLTLCVQIWISI